MIGAIKARARMVLAVVVAFLFAACSHNRLSTNEVVLYSSIDSEYTSAVATRFEEKNGIRVLTVTDSEASKSTGIVNRLIAEKTGPVADVFWSGDIMRAALLKSLEISEPYNSPSAADLPSAYSDPDGYYTGFAARLRVIIFNKQRIRAGETLPTSVEQLAEQRFASRSCIANPLFGTTSMHAAALFEVLGDDRAKKFFRAFSANGGKVLSSNGEVRRRVGAGDYAFGLTDSDDVNIAILDDKPVGMILPDQEGSGALLMPSAAVLIRRAPHPANAKKLVDFLVSAEVETMMADSTAAHIPLRRSLTIPSLFGKPLEQIRVMQIDYSKLARRTEELSSGFLKQWVDAAVQ
jgi:iron(III) transport system substrate-binding protein